MNDVRTPRRPGAARRASTAVVLALIVVACTSNDARGPFTFSTESTVPNSEPGPSPSDSVLVATASTPSPTTAPPTTAPPTTVPPTTAPPTSTSAVVESDPPSTTPSTDARTPTSPPVGTPTCPTNPGVLPEQNEPVRVILDTDFASDVDDAGALAVLHALADAGEVEILAVMVSDGGETPSHRAIDAINTYYARPDVPIGVVAGAAPAFSSSYVNAVANGFPNDIEDPPAAVDLYREILAGEPDGSVTIVSIGYLTNLDALLSSQPDERSASSGAELVAAKVRRWVAMGGAYPDSVVHPFGAEFNFVEDATAVLNSVAGWPTPAVFSGWEVGDVVLTGAALQEQTPPENPVREAYRLFNGGEDHRSWDLTAVLVAVRGTAGLFEVCAGRNVIGPGGSNTWEPSGGGPHGYLRLIVPAADVASVVDGLLVASPVGS